MRVSSRFVGLDSTKISQVKTGHFFQLTVQGDKAILARELRFLA